MKSTYVNSKKTLTVSEQKTLHIHRQLSGLWISQGFLNFSDPLVSLFPDCVFEVLKD